MISQYRRREISLAVQRAYQDAGLNPNSLTNGIIPLYDLIKTYSIGVAELKNMTSQKIADFLEAETGQRLLTPDTQEHLLAGYLYLQEYQGAFFGCILVESNPKLAPIARRRFSAAHELGHYLLHFLPLLEQHQLKYSEEALILTEGLYKQQKTEHIVDEQGEETEKLDGQVSLNHSNQAVFDRLGIYPEQMEEEANQFASELLMPTAACHTLAQQYRGRFGKKRKVLVGRLANEFLVSKQAMERRLFELQLPQRLNKE